MSGAYRGWASGFAGMLIFSGSMPATRIAVSGFDPVFLTAMRGSIAGVLGLLLLVMLRERRPARGDLLPLAATAAGVVIGFPLLSALALERVDAARSLVFLGLLPLITAIFGFLRAGERPHPVFWIFSGLGAALVAGFALGRGGSSDLIADGMMMAGLILCGMAYAEGARLSRHLGGWQVISWALVLALPAMLALSLFTAPATLEGIALPVWLSVGYVSVFSMLIGFIFWYRGLAQGGIAAVSQLQLLMPFFGLMLAALLLHEHISGAMLATAAGIVLCVAGAKHFSRPGSRSAAAFTRLRRRA